MGKQSFFLRNYLAHSLLILFTFLLAGSVFSHQLGVYARGEKQSQLKTTAFSVARQTAVVTEEPSNMLVRELYEVYINQIAASDQASILVTDPKGRMVFYAAPEGYGDVRKGQVVLSNRGVVGRIEQVGKLYSKIILITDINSKIPVMVERTRVRGILTGDNTPTPKMVFIPLEAELTVGDRIVTSGVAGTFPAGLPVGKISSIEKNNVKIKTFTNLERLEYVKIVDYGL